MHGSGLTHIVWSLHEQFLASKGYRVLSVDLPGHGSSEGPAIKSIEEIADWIKKSMEKLKINEISFMGHSQGCLVGLEFASRFPKLIKSLKEGKELPQPQNKKGDIITINLMQPVCVLEGITIALLKMIKNRWALVGYGKEI